MASTASLWKCALLYIAMCLKVGADHHHNPLNGRSLRMAAENWDPWLTISEGGERDDGLVVYSGIMANILEYLQGALNFTTVLVRPPDGAWGAPANSDDLDGDWGGMVGLVKRNEADFGLGMYVCKRHYTCYNHSQTQVHLRKLVY